MNTAHPVARIFWSSAGAVLRPRRVPPVPSNPSRILVVRQHDQLGDMICVIPTLRALKRAHPRSKITLVASPVNYEIMRGHPALEEVLLFDKREGWTALLRTLRARRFELAIVPSTVSVSLTSGLLARFSGAPVRIGPGRLEGRENPADFLFTHPVDLDWSSTPARHQAARNADILSPLGIVPDDLTTNLGLSGPEVEQGRRIVEPLRKAHRKLIGIHPGAAKPGNRWPVDSFLRLAELLHESFGAAVVVTIGPRDEEEYRILKARLNVPHQFVRGEPIRTVATVISALDLFISNDTGPLHIAGALPVPALGLFGPTDPRQWAPPGRLNHYVSAKDGAVASIGPEEVLDLSRVVLAGAGP